MIERKMNRLDRIINKGNFAKLLSDILTIYCILDKIERKAITKDIKNSIKNSINSISKDTSSILEKYRKYIFEHNPDDGLTIQLPEHPTKKEIEDIEKYLKRYKDRC